MPLSAEGIEAWIQVGYDAGDDGEEAEMYSAEATQTPSGPGWSAWIASQLGREFTIHWRNTDVFCQTVGRVWVDGIECSGEILRGPNHATKCAGRRTSGSTVAPFVFSNVNLTDDDTFLDSTSSREVGTIKLEIWTINMTGTKQFSLKAPIAQSKVHERTKKGVAHQVKFGAPVEVSTRAAAVIEYLDSAPLVTFVFRYRSMDILRANDIVSEAEVKRAASRARGILVKQEEKPAKRLKREPTAAFKPGEIIDLTRDSPAPEPEVIDLT
ncbi:hypothetical protein MKEN_00726100 [Mycena kentingensis (nom. inval.)]|nr:hypothetical protein MKEN_00726100 [Mycena kentingensis (nom. inval.)]